jgi:hypothetical protein
MEGTMSQPVKKTAPKSTRAAAAPKKPAAKKTTVAATSAAKPRATAARKPAAAKRAPVLAQVYELNHDTIARRAYELFESSGWTHGRDIEFWLEAERQLKVRREA